MIDYFLTILKGFQTGNTNNPTYNGQYFADNEDVIVVSAKFGLRPFM